jgi:hypothetical protein
VFLGGGALLHAGDVHLITHLDDACLAEARYECRLVTHMLTRKGKQTKAVRAVALGRGKEASVSSTTPIIFE